MTKITSASIDSPIKPTWCPGCGNFSIIRSLRTAIIELGIDEKDLVLIYGIGCSGNMADFNKTQALHSLHGRAIPNAIGIKLANHKLKVIIIAGDGDTYGEAINHLTAASRGNHDISVFVHNNMVYSLTTGQSSPTTAKGMVTKSTPDGVIEKPVNPLALALAAEASFVARGYTGKGKQLVSLMKQAIEHPGFSLVDIFQPCPTFNKINTDKWFSQKVYDLDSQKYNAQDKKLAYEKSQELDKLPIGLFYQEKNSLPYHAQVKNLKNKTLLEQRPSKVDISKAIATF
jgi:2-oxoglutarate/2-oxoacid ferredoxin oxidoreductase subunit beta